MLVDFRGNVKLTDFGLARDFVKGGPNPEYTKGIATRWYRPVDILYGGKSYNEGVDIWALGCTLAELLLRAPIFKGDSDIDQLGKIFEIMGNPNVTQPTLTT